MSIEKNPPISSAECYSTDATRSPIIGVASSSGPHGLRGKCRDSWTVRQQTQKGDAGSTLSALVRLAFHTFSTMIRKIILQQDNFYIVYF
jgi:hypothetical protein